MRAGVLSALAAATGVSAHYGGHHNYHPELRGCNKHHKGEYFPDQHSFCFPGHKEHEHKHWDLCRDNHHCRPEESYGQVDFEFFEEELIFDFFRREEREEFIFEEVEIFISTGEALFDEEHRYGSHNGHCGYDPDHHYRCRFPYEKLVEGGYHGLCPKEQHHHHHNQCDSNFIFFVKIKTIINIREERVELFNRGENYYNHHDHYNHHLLGRGYNNYGSNYDNSVQDEYFRLGYSCSECKEEQYLKEFKNHHEQEKCSDYGCSKPYCPKPHCHSHILPHPYPLPEHHHGHHGHHPGHHHGHHGHHGHHHGHHHPQPHHCGHCPSKKCHPKPQHPHWRRNLDRYEDFECEGAFVKAYGRGDNTFAFEELTNEGYPNSCGIEDEGYYHRYSKSDLEVKVDGPITYDEREFGFFEIELKKKGDDAFIFVEVKVEDVDYFVAEVAVFVECDGGPDDYWGSDLTRPNVCRPESYPNRHHNEEGIRDFEFEILDEFKCEGDYFIAIFVLVCVKDGNDCQYRRYDELD